MITEPMKIVLLPGIDGTDRFFKPFIAALDDRFEAVPVSYPEDQPLGYEDLLPIVLPRILSHMPCFVLGESFGGPLAVMAAARAGRNLRGLILSASFATSPLSFWLNRLRPLVTGPLLSRRRPKRVLERLLCAGCSPATARYIQRNLPELPDRVYAARVRAVMGVDVRAELARLELPILYIRATGDRVVGLRSLKAITKIRPDVTVAKIEGPHMILSCAPQACAEVLGEWAGGRRRAAGPDRPVPDQT